MFRASFSRGLHSLARREGIVNIQMDHMPRRRGMLGVSVGNRMLYERSPPTARAIQAWYSNNYSREGTAGEGRRG